MNKQDFESWLCNYEQAREERVQRRIIELFDRVQEIIGLSSEETLQGVDFDSRDLSIEKLESIISELRAIVFLSMNGFTEISPRKKYKNKQHFDVSANKQNIRFAIEVACLTRNHSRKKLDGRSVYELDEEKFVKTLFKLAQEKKSQLDVSDNQGLRMLIFVVNRSPENELYVECDYKNSLCLLSDALRWGQGYYFAIVTGSCDLVYPDFDRLDNEKIGMDNR